MNFNGFTKPQENWSKLPHQFIERLNTINSLAELKIILYTIRHTWGYGDDYKKITVDEFMNGRKRKDGSRIDNGTGLVKTSVISGIKKAIKDEFLFEYIDDSDKGRIKKIYSLTKQGYKVCTPEVQNLHPRGKKVVPRTEKETIKKETTSTTPPQKLNPSKGKDVVDSPKNKNPKEKATKELELKRLGSSFESLVGEFEATPLKAILVKAISTDGIESISKKIQLMLVAHSTIYNPNKQRLCPPNQFQQQNNAKWVNNCGINGVLGVFRQVASDGRKGSPASYLKKCFESKAKELSKPTPTPKQDKEITYLIPPIKTYKQYLETQIPKIALMMTRNYIGNQEWVPEVAK